VDDVRTDLRIGTKIFRIDLRLEGFHLETYLEDSGFRGDVYTFRAMYGSLAQTPETPGQQ